MIAGRRFTIWCSGASSKPVARCRSPPPSESAAGCSRSESAPGSACRFTRRDMRITGVDLSDAMLDKARDRVRDCKLDNVEGLAVMDAETSRVRRRQLRRRRRAICRHRGAPSRARARRVPARGAAGRRDRDHDPGERRRGAAPHDRACADAGHQPPRLPHRISVGALPTLVGRKRQCASWSNAGRCRRSAISHSCATARIQ